MGVPTTPPVGHVLHVVMSGVGVNWPAAHAVIAVVEQLDPDEHGVHLVPPAVVMKKPGEQAVHAAEFMPALTLIVPALQFVQVMPAVEYLPAAHAPPHVTLLKGAPTTPSTPAGHEGAFAVPTPGGQ